MADKNYTDSFLDDQEKLKLQQFAEDETMYEAVRKVLLAGLYQNGAITKGKKHEALRNAAFRLASHPGEFTNEALGQDLRGLWEGVNALEAAYKAIENYARPTLPTKKVGNSAR